MQFAATNAGFHAIARSTARSKSTGISRLAGDLSARHDLCHELGLAFNFLTVRDSLLSGSRKLALRKDIDRPR
ncbi:hypothetical protein B1810_10300 [Panacagrimonas perspica]|uniref:hypothetical protein n=1 Tax=Panacagrimonas perspica TaxID=381431 RepID=UPI00105CBE94|nr:hypothetical protein [Panacagrimonas perspica]THD02985.1 hypothetical protein B1810_10300 [Panacagrimonas perspica]